MPLANAEIPVRDPVGLPPTTRPGEKIDPRKGVFATVPWIEWWTRVSTTLNETAAVRNVVSATGQQASIGLTDFSGGVLGSGLYRLSYYVRVTRPSGGTSSISVLFAWTDGGIPQAAAGAALTTNTDQTWGSDSILVFVDAATPVEFSTTYASTGAPVMQYQIHAVIEQVRA